MRRFLPCALTMLTLGCATLGPELRPVRRVEDRGWVLTLHAKEGDRWTLALWHPGPFEMGQEPLRASLVGEAQTPRTIRTNALTEVQTREGVETKVGPVAVASTEMGARGSQVSATRTTWEVDRARWQTGRPFQLRVKRGLAPFTPERTAVLEITLGSEPGQAQGLAVRVLDEG